MKFIDVEYNCELKPLESVLAGIARPGNSYVSGAVEVPMPQVSIEDFGMLSFPVADPQIAALLRHAERAPMAGFHSKTERGVKQEIFAHFVLVTLKRLFANRAYGRGERTILDTSVRRVWQIAAGKIRIAGKSWPANFANILSSVAAGLGCDGASIRAEGDR